jgi:hypothetical protein
MILFRAAANFFQISVPFSPHGLRWNIFLIGMRNGSAKTAARNWTPYESNRTFPSCELARYCDRAQTTDDPSLEGKRVRAISEHPRKLARQYIVCVTISGDRAEDARRNHRPYPSKEVERDDSLTNIRCTHRPSWVSPRDLVCQQSGTEWLNSGVSSSTFGIQF